MWYIVSPTATARSTSGRPDRDWRRDWRNTLDRRYCFPQLATTLHDGCRWQFHLPGGWSRDSTSTSLYSVSRCHQCPLNSEAEHSIVSSNHCFMIASFQKRLGSKLAAHGIMAERQQHLGFKSTQVKGPSSWLRLSLDCRGVLGVLQWPKRT